jgi:hypothetical protein|tara:strand:- start:204 stop:464 length:261 start_codon:yes stop_codon:yes gene_type:complete
MSKNKKYGYDRQDAVISKFRRDAKSSNKTSAVAQAIARSKKAKKSPKSEIRMSGSYVPEEFQFSVGQEVMNKDYTGPYYKNGVRVG